MHPSSGNNPLLNRIYDATSHKKKRKGSFKQETSARDKVLIPKLKSKTHAQQQVTLNNEKQKAQFFRSNIPKLPSISQKQIEPERKGNFEGQLKAKPERGWTGSKKYLVRDRKLSFREAESYFPTELSFTAKIEELAPSQINQIHRRSHKKLVTQKIPTMKTEEKTEEKASEELFEFLSLIEKSEQLKEQFCYMNRGEMPYSYEMVEYENVNKNEFLVVSIRGITIYLNGEAAQFTTAEKLSRQIEIYQKVKKIEFFREYVKEKSFKHWKYRAIRRKFEGKCKLISHNLFSQKNMLLQSYLGFLFALADDYHTCKFLDVSISRTETLEGLVKIFQRKQGKIVKSIQYFDTKIKEKLKETIQNNMAKFKQEERVSLGTPQEKKEQSYLPFDAKKKPMRYTQMAKLKQFEENMYRLIKMTDLVRFNVKTKFVLEGLINYVEQLENLHRKYITKESGTNFAGWVNVQVSILKENKNEPARFVCTPKLDEIKAAFEAHRQGIVLKIAHSNELLIQSKDELYCETYEQNEDEIPNKIEIKYYMKENKDFQIQLFRCEESLQLCINDIMQYLNKGEQHLLSIYDDCYEDRAIGYYMENQTLKRYLQAHINTRQNLSEWEATVQFGIAYLNMKNVVEEIREKFELKYKKIISAIPQEVLKRCEKLASDIKYVYNVFKQNPSTISEYIKMVKSYHEYKGQMENLESRIQGIYELEETVYKNGLPIGQHAKLNINQCTTYFRELNKRLEEIQSNEQKEKKKFQKMVDDLVDPLDEKSENMYNLLYNDILLTNSESNALKCLQSLDGYEQNFSNIKSKKNELFYYQNQLKMGHKDIPNYFKLQSNLQWLNKLWKGRKIQKQYDQIANKEGYIALKKIDLHPLKIFLKNIDSSSSEVEAVELLQNFRQETQFILQTFEVCKLIVTDTLQNEHFKDIKNRIQTKNQSMKDHLFTIEGGKTITCMQLIKETNILEIQEDLQEISFASSQESIIRKHLGEIQDFWKKHRIVIKGEDLARNQTQIPHLADQQNQPLIEKLGYHLMTMKNIQGSKHSVGKLRVLVSSQIINCQYCIDLLNLWAEVQKQWIKLLPLMTNCPSVKHQSNVFFEFTSTDTTIKKHNRKMADFSSMRKIIEDTSERRYFQLLENCGKQLKEINKIFNNFLEMKRNTYHRFFFITDQQLITILEKTKGLRSLAEYVGVCFNCDRIILDKELISGFETSMETLKLRKTIVKGEADEMFKLIQENMKSSIKLSIMGLFPKMKIGMNIEQEHSKDYSLQAVLMSDKLLWTEMTQNYLQTDSYQSYQLVLRRPVEQLVKYLRKDSITRDRRYKMSIRLNNLMNLREIGTEMMNEQTSKDDFKWKSHLKYSIEGEEVILTQFDRKINYGLEYHPPSKIVVPTKNWWMLLQQIHYTAANDKVLLVKGTQGFGKRSLLKSCAAQYGYYYKELVCNKNISIQYIMRFVQGAIIAGAWLSFYQFEHLDSSVFAKLTNEIRHLIEKLRGDQNGMNESANLMTSSVGLNKSSTLNLSMGGNIMIPPSFKLSHQTLFSFSSHGLEPQKVSVYSFDTFVIAEPNYKKICEWLLHLQNFQDFLHLSARLIVFMDTVFPLLERVMGSYMSIMRKIIDVAAKKRKDKMYRKQKFINEKELLALAFKEEVIDKSDQNIHKILDEAVHAYFDINFQAIQKEALQAQRESNAKGEISISFKNTFYSKKQIICSLLENQTKNILIIGPRSNKTTTIQQSCKKLGRQILRLYPMADEHFFEGEAPEKLNAIDQNIIVHYDGEILIREWSDLIISDYLLLQGQKLYLKNQIIIEIRDVTDCSPSFVGSCQVVYIGDMLTKKEKFLLLSEADCSPQSQQFILQPIYQIFGNQLNHLPKNLVEPFATFVKQYAKNIQSKNYHKLFTWFGTIAGIDGLWNRYYGGRYTDFTVNKYSQELVPIDETKYLQISDTQHSALIHTKSSVLYYELIKNLLSMQQPILLSGGLNCGKSALVKMIVSSVQENTGTRISLPVTHSTKQWCKQLRQSLTTIRRDGRSYLMSVGQSQIIVTVDDLDLGVSAHREYLRQIIDNKLVRDDKFEQFSFQAINLVISWHKNKDEKLSSANSGGKNSKLIDRAMELELPSFSKESIQTILRITLENFAKKNRMNKQVVSAIDTSFIKCLLIVFDDIANIKNNNYAASIILATLRNLISLPKKNSFINLPNYIKFFRTNFEARLFERCFTTKTHWKINSIYENINKVIFGPNDSRILGTFEENHGEHQEEVKEISDEDIYMFMDKQYRMVKSSKLKEKIHETYPSIYIFEEMLKIVIKLSNQFQTIDSHCVIIGRNGTGKKTILKLAAFINKIDIQGTLEGAILKCSKNKDVILYEEYDRRHYQQLMEGTAGTLFKQISSCRNDEELEKMLSEGELKRKYLEQKNEEEQQNERILKKAKDKIKNVLILNNLAKYKRISLKFREINRYFICFIDQWPVEALLNISGVYILPQAQTGRLKEMSPFFRPIGQKDEVGQFHITKILAEVYTRTNQIIHQHEEPSISIKKFQQFLKIYHEMYTLRFEKLTEKIEFYTKIYSKFQEACVMIKQWENRVQILRVELEDSLKKLDQQLLAGNKQSMTFSILHKNLSDQEQVIVNKNTEMNQIKRQMEQKMGSMKKVMENIQKIVMSIQRSEMSELKKIYKNNKIVSFGLECLCLLFDEQICEKSINKILADPNLMMKMKSQQILGNRNFKVEEKIKTELGQISEALEQVKGNIANIKILVEWIKSLIEYWKINEQYLAQKQEHRQHKAEYEKSKEKQEKIQKQLEDLKQKALSINAHLVDLFKQKEETLSQYNKISLKIKNAAKLVPSLTKSQEQTWQVVKGLREQLGSLNGNLILATACLVFLPLKRLKLKTQVINEIKKIMNLRLVSFSENFINNIAEVEDGIFEDLNVQALKEFDKISMIIIDPERRALNYVFQQDIDLHALIKVVTKEELQSQNVSPKRQLKQSMNIQIRENDSNEGESEAGNFNETQSKNGFNIGDYVSQVEKEVNPYQRDGKIYHLSEENVKKLLLEMPDQTLIIDWKYTSLDNNTKIFMKIASNKKPEYFEVKKELNIKIKKDLLKIESYKREIYEKICQKKIKILDDESFIELSEQLEKLQLETVENKKLEAKKTQQILNLSKEINDQVNKIVQIVTCLKKIRNVALDLILEIACQEGDTIQNIIRWALSILFPEQRLGWLLAVACQFQHQNNEQLMAILVKDLPLKINEGLRVKKPLGISAHNFQNLMRICQYSNNLKAFSDNCLKFYKEFELWTLDNSTDNIASSFRSESVRLTLLEEMVVFKIFKQRMLLRALSRCLVTVLPYQLTPYENTQMLNKVNCRYPILAYCPYEYLEKLAEDLNESRIVRKSICDFESSLLNMRYYLWKHMENGTWVVFHSISSAKNREIIETIVEYVMNYDEQKNFRVFLYVQQLSSKQFKSFEQLELQNSKYLQNIGVPLHDQPLSISKLIHMAYHESEMSSPLFKRIKALMYLAHKACLLRFPYLKFYKTHKKIKQIIDYINISQVSLELNVNFFGDAITTIYTSPAIQEHRNILEEIIMRIVEETKAQQKVVLGINMLPNESLDAQREQDEKIQRNHQLMGMQECYILDEEEKRAEIMIETLGQIVYDQKSLKEEVPQLRSALSRFPQNPIIFSREFKNKIFLNIYLSEIAKHNEQISLIKQFVQWLNNSTTVDFNEEDPELPDEDNSIEIFNWKNLTTKVNKIINNNSVKKGKQIRKNKIRAALFNWISILKRRHEFLLYWNIDSNVFSLHPAIFFSFDKLVSIFVIRHLINNYEKIKAESQSRKQNVLYTLQIQFSRQTDQKLLYLTEGIILPELVYKNFKYNFQVKMLDPLLEGEEPANLVMLKMKRIPFEVLEKSTILHTQSNKGNSEEEDEYRSPDILISIRDTTDGSWKKNGIVSSIVKLETYIDGNFSEWELRSPKLISE